MSQVFNKIKAFAAQATGYLNWTIPPEKAITDADRQKIRELLAKDYYIILTRHPGHFSTYGIAFAHWFLTGKWGYYGHALLNVENDVFSDNDFEFMEATSAGVHYSDFDQVFDDQCGSVCLLKPKSMKIEEWTCVVEKSKSDLGKPYDMALDVTQTAKLNCIELVRDALMGEPNYTTDYADLERMIAKYRNLDPHMAYECVDFEVVFETRH